MKFNNTNFKKTLALSLVFVSVTSNTAFANLSFHDVPQNHWAYEEISFIADRGYIAGDTSGNFKPDDNISKFETAVILARVAGFKYYDISPEEQNYFNRAYEKNRNLILQYSNAFTRWSSTADKEIAFLLEKEILTVEDLNQFIVKDANGNEQLRALSRVECAEFLVRLIGKTRDALLVTDFSSPFSDHEHIPESKLPFVYYLKEEAVISPDENGNFNPFSTVTRASMASLLDKVLRIETNGSTITDKDPSNTAVSAIIETLSGKVDKYYPNIEALQIIDNDGKKNLYAISPISNIYIDSYLKTVHDLKSGMPFVAVVNNNTIADLRAQSISTDTSVDTSTQTTFSRLEGVISSAKTEIAANNITIELRMLNPFGEIFVDQRTFALADDCEIQRGTTKIDFEDIVVGDVVTAKVSGNSVHSILLKEKDISLESAILLEKNEDAVLVLEHLGEIHEFKVLDTTSVTRQGSGETSWRNLRVGDSIDLKAEYDNLIEVRAFGVRSTVDGIVEEVRIGRNGSSVVLKNNDGQLVTYGLITDTIDVYGLRVGNRVRLRLDSKEAETLITLEEISSNYSTGYITHISAGKLELFSMLNGPSSSGRTVNIDTDTLIINSRTGELLSQHSLKNDMKVYVVFKNNSNNAAAITVLSE